MTTARARTHSTGRLSSKDGADRWSPGRARFMGVLLVLLSVISAAACYLVFSCRGWLRGRSADPGRPLFPVDLPPVGEEVRPEEPRDSRGGSDQHRPALAQPDDPVHWLCLHSGPHDFLRRRHRHRLHSGELHRPRRSATAEHRRSGGHVADHAAGRRCARYHRPQHDLHLPAGRRAQDRQHVSFVKFVLPVLRVFILVMRRG